MEKENGIEEQYLDLLRDILSNGVRKTNRTGVDTLSVFGRTLRHKMSDGFPLITTKKMFFKGIVTELLWFMRGETNIKILLEEGNKIWVGDAYKRYLNYANSIEEPDYAVHVDDPINNVTRPYTKEEFSDMILNNDAFGEKWGDMGKVYGFQWRNWEGRIDQLVDVINKIKEDPDNRRLLVSAWNPGDLEESVLPPCHYAFQFYTRELNKEEKWELYSKHYDREAYDDNVYLDIYQMDSSLYPESLPKRALSLMFNMRSNDVPLGLPFNIASYALLLKMVGKIVNMVPYELVSVLGDAHIYVNQVEGIKEQLERAPFPLPNVEINDEFWLTETEECGVGGLSSNVSGLIDSIYTYDFILQDYTYHPSIKMPLSN